MTHTEDKPRLRAIISYMDSADDSTHTDRALVCMLRRWFDELPEYEDGYYHKMFRQTDVVDDTGRGGYTDMVFWHLLHESRLFWEAAAPRDDADFNPI